jgi:hypothetical protein
VIDAPLRFTLRAEDPDIDPADPTAHPMTFAVISGPEHGVLLGDLSEVDYEPPNDAFVWDSYQPAQGFLGRDELVVLATDPFGASSTAVIAIDVVAEVLEDSLSGDWETWVSFNVQSTSMTAFRSKATLTYRIGSVVAEAVGTLEYSAFGPAPGPEFKSLTLSASLPLLQLGALESTLVLDPLADPSFDFLLTNATIALGGLSLTYLGYLDAVQTLSYSQVTVRATVCDARIESVTRFAEETLGCGTAFDLQTVAVDWNWCGVKLRGSLTLECGVGFGGFAFEVERLPVLGVSSDTAWLYLDAALRYATGEEGKAFDASLGLSLPSFACVEMLTELVMDGPLRFDGLSVYGVRIRQTLAGGAEIRSDTSFVTAKNAQVTGYSDYFEALLLSGPMPTCCGGPGEWLVATYFNATDTTLFDWGMTMVLLDIGLGDHLRWTAQVVFRSGFFGDPVAEFTIGWKASW